MLPERHDNSIELRRRVRESVGDVKADRWFGTQTVLAFVSRDSDSSVTLRVQAATSYLLKYLQQHYSKLLGEIGESVVGETITIDWEIDEELAAVAPTKASNGNAKQRPPRTRSSNAAIGRRVHHELTDFSVGDCNRVPFNAAKLIASQPLGSTGALVLFGPVGCGKTHLLESIAAQVRKDGSARTLVINGPHFGNLFKQAMAEYSTASFRQRFQSVELLCIDDLDFFESKKSFQDELLQTIERLDARGGTVVITSSLHPRMLTNLSDALVSRLLSGAVCRIEAPSQPVRRSVAQARAKELEADLTADAIRYVADRFSGSVREVVGAINTLHAHAISTGERMTLGAARSILASLERDAAKVVRIVDIEAAVSKLFGLPATEMRSARRSRSVSQPRQVAMYLSRKLTNGAYKEIGEHFGGRNHSTVMAAERNINKMIEKHQSIQIGFQSLAVDEVVARLEEQIRVG